MRIIVKSLLAVSSLISQTAVAQQPIRLFAEPSVIEPGYYTWQEFYGGHIYGKFRISNPKNDVKCFVFDEEGFINWKNNHPSQVYFQTPAVAAGSIDIKLRPGQKYYIVFSNLHSVLATATVVLKAEIFVKPMLPSQFE